jgi:hypothetical protein
MKLIKCMGLVLAFFGIFVGCYLFLTSYDSFIDMVADFINVSNIKGISDPEGKFRSILSPIVYFQIKLLSLLPVIIGALVFKFSGNLLCCAKETVSILSATWHDVKIIKAKYLLIACLIILASLITRLYYALQPITYDEAWTYIYFTSRGFLTSIAYYPQETPNNHVLNSALTSLTYHLPFSQTINLRLPSIVIGTISLFAFYLTFRKFFNDRIALWLMSIFSFLCPVLFYGYKARGYSLAILAFIICFFCAVQIVKSTEHEDIRRYWSCLALGAVLGLYSLPSFLYPYFALTTFLAFTFLYRRNIKRLITLFTSIFITGVITVLLYSPIFIVSGFSAVANNKYVSPIPRDQMLDSLYGHFIETVRYLFYSEWVLLIIILLSIFLLSKVRAGSDHVLASYVIYVSPLILIMHSVIAYPRTWVYLVIPVLFLLGCFMKHLSADKYGKLLVSSAVLFMAILISQFYAYINVYERFSYGADKLSSFLISKKADRIYVNHFFIKTNLIYLFEERGVHVEVVSSKLNPLEDNLIAESDFEFLILGKQVNNIPGYKLTMQLCIPCQWKDRMYVYSRT